MPIANIDSANSPGITSYTLLMGEDVPLYTNVLAATGALSNTFGVPPQSSVWRGQLWLQAVGIGAGGTALTVDVEVSLDGGTTFAKLATGVALITASVSTAQKVDISGLGGNGKMRLNGTTVTLGGATGFNIFAHIG